MNKKVKDMTFEEQIAYIDNIIGNIKDTMAEHYVPRTALFLEQVMNQKMHCFECHTNVILQNGNLICLHKGGRDEVID